MYSKLILGVIACSAAAVVLSEEAPRFLVAPQLHSALPIESVADASCWRYERVRAGIIMHEMKATPAEVSRVAHCDKRTAVVFISRLLAESTKIAKR